MGNKDTIYYLIYGGKGKTWKQILSNQLGRFVQGKTIGVKGTDIMYFIPLNKIPQGRDTMYANYVSDYRPLKYEPYQIQLVLGRKN